MIYDSIIVTGSAQVSGSLSVTGGITGSFQGTATTASYVLNAVSASFATSAAAATTASYVLNAVSSSFATSAANATTSSYILNAASASYALTSSFATTAVTSSFANAFTVAGTLTATTLVVQTITSSVLYSSGSNIFGNSLSNTQLMTGSVGITGSLAVAGATTLTGALSGTSAAWSNINTFTGAAIGAGSQRWIGTDGASGLFLNTPTGAGINLAINNNPVFGIASTGTSSFSSNVGIGTTSPRGLLQIYGAEVAAFKTYTGQGNTGGGDTIINAYRLDSSNAYLRVTDIVALGDDTNNRGSTIRLMTTNTSGTTTSVMTITPSGSVGIGITNPAGKVHIAATTGVTTPGSIALAIRDSGNSGYGFDFNLEGVATGDMSLMRTEADSQSQVMTFKRSNGNVGIGTTSPASLLTVNGSSANTESGQIKIIKTGANEQTLHIGYNTTSDYAYLNAYKAGLGYKPIALNPDGGNVGIGTTTPDSKLHIISNASTGTDNYALRLQNTTTVSDARVGISFLDNAQTGSNGSGATIQVSNNGVDGGGNLLFGSLLNGTNTERMRITSGGYLKVSNDGTYAAPTGPYHEIIQTATDNSIGIAANTAASPYGLEIAFRGADPNNTTNYMLGLYTTNPSFVWIYRIWSNGTVSARSDARWKKNITTTRDGYLEDLCKLRVVKYNWYNNEDDAPKELGLIAQEVEEVFPNLVQYDKVTTKKQIEQEDGSFIEQEVEDGESRSVKTSVLPYMLLKGLQEANDKIENLQSTIQSLQTRITQLENK